MSTEPGSTTSTSGTPTHAQTSGHEKPTGGNPSKAGKAPDKVSHGPDQTEAAGTVGEVHTDATDDSGGSGPGGLPAWIAPVAIGILFLGAGGIVLMRRKSSGGV